MLYAFNNNKVIISKDVRILEFEMAVTKGTKLQTSTSKETTFLLRLTNNKDKPSQSIQPDYNNDLNNDKHQPDYNNNEPSGEEKPVLSNSWSRDD